MVDSIWQAEIGNVVYAESGSLRLTVHLTPNRAEARYMVFRRSTREEPEALVCSGNEVSIWAAMQKAEQVARRLDVTVLH